MHKDRVKKHTEGNYAFHNLILSHEEMDDVGQVIIEGGVDEVVLVLINYNHANITFAKSMWYLTIIKSALPEITLPWIEDEDTLCKLGTNTLITNIDELIHNDDVRIIFTDREERWGNCPMCTRSFTDEKNEHLTHICAKRDYGSPENARTFIEQPLITCKQLSL